MDGKQKGAIIGLILFAIIAGLLTLGWVFGRGKGLWTIAKTLMIVFGVAIILGLIVYLVYLIFKKTQVDAVRLNKQRILKACFANRPGFTQQLYFEGSTEWENHKVGVIKGICQIKSQEVVGEQEIKFNRDGKEEVIKKPKYRLFYEDCIAFKRSDAFFLSWFMPYQIVRVTKEERSSLNSDIVFLKSMAFTPELYGFLYLPSRYRDTVKIDQQVTEEIHRFTLQNLLQEQINIVQETLAISPRHQKELEKQNTQMLQQIKGESK